MCYSRQSYIKNLVPQNEERDNFIFTVFLLFHHHFLGFSIIHADDVKTLC